MSVAIIERKRNTISQLRQQKKLEKLRPFIGKTPLFPLHQLLSNKKIELWAKLEWQQYGGSVKARPAFAIFEDAVRSGFLADGQSLLDASSGNTAIAYAHIGRALGIPVTIVLPCQTKSQITHFVAGLGTTGTFVGTSIGLNHYNPTIQNIALQPETALHGLEGWKHLETARVPGIYENHLVDYHRSVTTESAYAMIKRVAMEAGLLLSPSAGAALAGAVHVADELDSGIIVTVLADNADKYSETLKSLF